MAFEQGIVEKGEKFEHLEAHHQGRSSLRPDSTLRASFDRRNSAALPSSRRESIRRSFDKANLATVLPDSTHMEVNDDETTLDIDDIAVSWYVWLIAATASIAGSLFGYDTGIISAVLVYLNNDLNHRPTSPSEKELITSLCSGGAFIGSIIAGLTADKVPLLSRLLFHAASDILNHSTVVRLQSTSDVFSSPSELSSRLARTRLLRCQSGDWWLASVWAQRPWLSHCTLQRSLRPRFVVVLSA